MPSSIPAHSTCPQVSPILQFPPQTPAGLISQILRKCQRVGHSSLSLTLSSSLSPHLFLFTLASSSFRISPPKYTHPPATAFALPSPIAEPRTRPLALNLPRRDWRLRRARSAYRPDQAAVRPALAVVKPDRLRYEEKRSGGVKRKSGRGWKGLAWRAVMSVASREGGRDDASGLLADVYSNDDVFLMGCGGCG